MTARIVQSSDTDHVRIEGNFGALADDQKREQMLSFCDTAKNTATNRGDRWGNLPADVIDLWRMLQMGYTPVEGLNRAIEAFNAYVGHAQTPAPAAPQPPAQPTPPQPVPTPAPAPVPNPVPQPAPAPAPTPAPAALQPPAQPTPPQPADDSQAPAWATAMFGPVRDALPTDDEGNFVKVAPLDRLEAVEKKVDEIRSVLPRDENGKLVAFDWKSGKVKVKNATFSFWPGIIAFVVTFILMLVILTPSTGFLGALYHIGTWGTAALVGVIVMAVMAVLALMKSQKSEKSATTADNDTSKGGA